MCTPSFSNPAAVLYVTLAAIIGAPDPLPDIMLTGLCALSLGNSPLPPTGTPSLHRTGIMPPSAANEPLPLPTTCRAQDDPWLTTLDFVLPCCHCSRRRPRDGAWHMPWRSGIAAVGSSMRATSVAKAVGVPTQRVQHDRLLQPGLAKGVPASSMVARRIAVQSLYNQVPSSRVAGPCPQPVSKPHQCSVHTANVHPYASLRTKKRALGIDPMRACCPPNTPTCCITPVLSVVY